MPATHLHTPPWGLILPQAANFDGGHALTFTPAVSEHRDTFYFETWVQMTKIAVPPGDQHRALVQAGNDSTDFEVIFLSLSGNLVYQLVVGSSTKCNFSTVAKLTDTTLWQHVAVRRVGTDLRCWINGEEVSAFSSFSVGADAGFFSHNIPQNVGLWAPTHHRLHGNLARTLMVFGDPSITPADTLRRRGVMVPKPLAIADYGANGFLLNFANAADTGEDSSGNGNDMAAAAGYAKPVQRLGHSPTDGKGGAAGCHAAFEPLTLSADVVTFSNGNLDAAGTTTVQGTFKSTIALPAKDKWYAEAEMDTVGGSGLWMFGIAEVDFASGSFGAAGSWGGHASSTTLTIYDETTAVAAPTIANGDILQVAYDADTGEFWIGVDDVWYDSGGGTTGNPATGANPTGVISTAKPLFFLSGVYSGQVLKADFGQLGFTYTPPAGFKALNTANLPPGGTVTAGTNDEGDFVYTGGTPASVTWDGTPYDHSHDGSVIRFHGTGFTPQAGAGLAKAWTAVIETPVGVRRSMQPRAFLTT